MIEFDDEYCEFVRVGLEKRGWNTLHLDSFFARLKSNGLGSAIKHYAMEDDTDEIWWSMELLDDVVETLLSD